MNMSPPARKRFGQHFLVARPVIDDIVAAIGVRDSDTIVEIGPGRAAITEPLALCARKLHAIELDRDLIASLRQRFGDRNNVAIHEADALSFDYSTLVDNGATNSSLRIVGNLPYNISTPLLFHLLNFRQWISDAHFMLQKEVVDRMVAEPGSKRYGRLTVMLRSQCEVVSLFDVDPGAFSPPPKVTSSVCRLRPLEKELGDAEDRQALDQIVKAAFSKRRKTLRNALLGVVDSATIERCGLDTGARPEEIPVDAWVSLAKDVRAVARN